MPLPRAPALLFFVLIISLTGIRCQRPVIKIGRTAPLCSATGTQTYAIGQNEALSFWQNYTNTQGGLVVNGTAYDVEVIIYNDATDPQLMSILYERLVTVDNVSFLLSTFGDGRPAYAVAQQYGIPIINVGDYQFGVQYPGSTYGGNLFSVLADITELMNPCYDVLVAHGVKTANVAWGSDTSSLKVFNSIAMLKHGIVQMGPVQNISNDLSNVPDLISQWASDGADVFVGGFQTVAPNVGFVDQLRYYQYNPKAIVIVLGPQFASFRTPAGWEAHLLLAPDSWSPSLNLFDPFFNNSQSYYDAYVAAVGKEPDPTSTVAVAGAVLLAMGIKNADSLDRNAVRAALQSMNETSFWGLMEFQTRPFQQANLPYYCFQVDNSGLVHPITPTASNSQVPIIWPAIITPPPGYPVYTPPSDRNKWIGIGVGVGLGVLLIGVIVLVAVIIAVKYQLIFIPKAENTGEW